MQVNNLIKTAREITGKAFKTTTNTIRKTFKKEEDTFELSVAKSKKNIENASKVKEFTIFQPLIERFFTIFGKLSKIEPFSKEPEVEHIEKLLQEKGTVVRFHGNINNAKFINEGLTNIESAGCKLPPLIMFNDPKQMHGIGGLVIQFRNKNAHNAPIMFPTNVTDLSNWLNLADKSTSNKSHFIYHEMGHYLHFTDIPDTKTCMKIWSKADKNLIKKEVSQEALRREDGIEFVAEVFAGLIDGKHYGENIIDTYKQLKGPMPKNID